MQVHYSARGNFRPLQASLRGLNQQMTRSVGGFGRAAAKNVNDPMANMVKQIDKGQVGFRQLGTVMRNQNRILTEHNAMIGKNVSRMGMLAQRFALTNTAMHAFGRNTIAVGKNMQWAGRQVMIGLTLPLTMLAGASVKAAEEYDKNMTRIIKVNNEASRAAGESDEIFNLVADSIRRQTSDLVDLGASMGFLAAETTDMVAQFSQMGFVSAELDKLTDAALRLSRVSGTDLPTSIELTRLTAQAFGRDLDDLTETFARLNLVENNTALSLDEMANALPVVAGVANTMGLEIEQVSGLLAMMKENGISAKEGATALRTGLIQIVQEATDPAIEAFENVNLNLVEMKERMQEGNEDYEAGDIMMFFDELGLRLQELEGDQAALNDFTAAIGKLTGTRQAARFLTFLSEVPDRLEDGTVAQRAFMGATAEATEALRIYEFEQRQVDESAAGIAERLRAELNVEITRIGENFLDVANKLREVAVNITRWFNTLDDSTKKLVLSFGTFMALLGPIVMLAGIFTNAFGQILTVITKLLPRIDLNAQRQRALEKAYDSSTRAIKMNNAALQVNMGLNRAAAASAGANAGAQTAAAGVAGGGAAGGAGRATTLSAAAGGGRLGSAGKKAMGGITKALMFIPNLFLKGIPSIAKKALGGIRNAITSIGAKMLGMGGAGAGKMGMAVSGAAGKLMGGGALLKAGGAGIAAAAGPIAGIAAAIAAIPILADPAAFMESFRKALQGPMERFRGLWDQVQQQVQRVIELFRQSSEGGGGLSTMASIIGTIAGFLGGVIVEALNQVMRIVSGIIELFEGIMHLVDAIGHLFKGEWSEAGEAIMEMLKAIGRAFMSIFGDAIVWLMEKLADMVEHIPFVGDAAAEAIRRGASALKEAEILQSNINTLVSDETRLRREMEGVLEGHNEALRQSNDYLQEMADAGIDIRDLSEDQIMSNQLITDEMKAQAIAALRRLEIEKEIERLNRRVVELKRLESQSQGVDLMRNREHRVRLEREIHDMLEESPNLHRKVLDEIAAEREMAQWLGDGLDDAASSAEDLGDAIDEVELERLEKKAADLRDRIRESERAAQQWASALQSSMGEAISEIADATKAALDAQIKAQEEAFDKREQKVQSSHERDLKRIEEAAERELQRLDDREQAEQDAEDARRRFFENERARIEFLKGLQQDNVSMQESLARGDVGEAARIRIGLQASSEKFMLESYEREAQKFAEAKQSEIDAERDKIRKVREDQTKALEQARDRVLRQLAVEREAASKGADARRRAVEQYLSDWSRITPATEAEFRSHLANLTTNMNGFGISMEEISRHYTQASGNRIAAGFTDAVNRARAVVQEQDKWRKVGENSGAAFRAGLAKELKKVEADIEAVRDGKNIRGDGGPAADDGGINSYTPRGMQQGRVDGSFNFSPPSTTRSSPTRTTPNRASSSSAGSGGTMRFFHGGGGVDGGSPYKGLKRDERPAVLQTGEYVIQRSAVQSLGKDYLEMINNVSKYHDGGLIDYSRGSINEAGAAKAMAGYGMGSLATQGAADILKSAGVDPSIKSKYSRSVGGEAMGKAAGKQIAEVVEASMFAASMGDGAGWRTGSGAGWPPRRWAKIAGNTRAAQQFFQAQGGFPGGIGAGVHRGVQASDHSWGKALDFMVAPLGQYAKGEQYNRGWQVANWHLQNPGAFGTKYVIWDKLINSGDSRGWRPYTRYGSNPGATLGHYDHVHVSYLHDGGMVNKNMPSMRGGGKILTDNVPINAHKGERVLTAPSTAALERAIQNFSNNGGGGNTYNLEFKVDGGSIDEKALAKKVVFEIDKMERSQGRKRVLTG